LQRHLEQKKELQAETGEGESQVQLERVGSENVEDEEYAIIDL
jgi:hypothetical protein